MKKPLLLLVLLLVSLTTWATNFYVSPSGNDNNTGRAVSTPFLTLQRGADFASFGDTVFVLNGTYHSTNGPLMNITRSGDALGYITFKAYEGHKPKITASGNTWNAIIINGSYVVIDGFELEGNNANITYDQALAAYNSHINGGAPQANFNTNAISIGGPRTETRFPHHVTIRNCKVHDFPGGGISSIQADYTTIENNIVYNNAWYMMYGGSGISILNPFNSDQFTGYKNFVRNNICNTNKTTIPWVSIRALSDGNGIIIDVNQYPYGGVAGDPPYNARTLVENNISVNNGGSGIHTFKADHVDMINNTVYNNGYVVNYPGLFSNNCKDVNLINNIIYARTGGDCNSLPKNATEVYANNIYFNGNVKKTGVGDVVADPKFVNLSTDLLLGNFKLQATSPAIDQDSNLAGQYSLKDILGVTRPQGLKPDRGAYEYVAGVGVATLNEAEKSTTFPNPAKKMLTIQLASSPTTQTQVDIVNNIGLLMKTQILTAQNSEVGVEQLPIGLYMLVVRQNERVVSVNKFIKE